MKPTLIKKLDFKTLSNEFMNAARFVVLQRKCGEIYFLMNLEEQQKIQLCRLNQSDEVEILLEAKGYLYTYREGGLDLAPLYSIDDERSIISCLASVKQRKTQYESFEFEIIEFDLIKNEARHIYLGNNLGEPKKLSRFRNGDHLLWDKMRKYSPEYFDGLAPIDLFDSVYRINSTGAYEWCKRRKRKKALVKSYNWADKDEWHFNREHEIIEIAILTNQMILTNEWKDENNQNYIVSSGAGEELHTILTLPSYDFLINIIPQQNGCRIYTAMKSVDTNPEYRYQLRETIFDEKMRYIGENIIKEWAADLWINLIFSSNDMITAELLEDKNVIRISKYHNGICDRKDFTMSGLSMIKQVVHHEKSDTFFLLVSTKKNYAYKVLAISETKGIFWRHSLKATEDCKLYLSGTRLILVQIQHSSNIEIEIIHIE